MMQTYANKNSVFCPCVFCEIEEGIPEMRQQIVILLAALLTAPFAPEFCGTSIAQERVPVSKGAIRILKEVPLSSEIPGHLNYVNPTEEGRLVRKGDIVIRLTDDLIRAQHTLAERKAASEVEIKFAQVALDKALVDLQVQEEANSMSPGTYTESEIRQSKLEVKKAEAQLEKSREDKVILELEAMTKGVELKQYEVASPIDGVVTEIHRWPGEAVRQGDPVLTITDLTIVRAVLDVDFSYREMVSVGDEVEIIANEQPLAAGSVVDTSGDKRPTGGSILSQLDLNSNVPSAVREAENSQTPPSNRANGVTADKKFRGSVTYISTKLTTGSKRELEVYVNVPNRQDADGRYMLLEGVEVKAWILHK